MKYIILFFSIWLYLPVWGQPNNLSIRQLEIEMCTKHIYTVNEFWLIADSLQMSLSDISDYPVLLPVKNPCISSEYGRREHPIHKERRFHKGVDFAGVKGTAVYATGNGFVIRKGYDSGYGYFLEIQHSGGFHSFYAHLNKTLVNKGDLVKIGNQIASMGNSGKVTGNHLHYEVRKGKRFLNPLNWCLCLYGVLKFREFSNVQQKA